MSVDFHKRLLLIYNIHLNKDIQIEKQTWENPKGVQELIQFNLISKTYKAQISINIFKCTIGKKKTNKQEKTIIPLIIKIMNNYDNKNDKIR